MFQIWLIFLLPFDFQPLKDFFILNSCEINFGFDDENLIIQGGVTERPAHNFEILKECFARKCNAKNDGTYVHLWGLYLEFDARYLSGSDRFSKTESR